MPIYATIFKQGIWRYGEILVILHPIRSITINSKRIRHFIQFDIVAI